MKFTMTCRIDAITNYEGNFYHIVTTPAPDAYTKPSGYKVRSPKQLGQVGEEITIDCSVSGSVYQKSYLKNGVSQTIWDNKVFLDAVQKVK